MKTAFKWFVGLTLVLMLLSIIGGMALWNEIGADPGVHVHINGDEWSGWSSDGAPSWLEAVLGVGIAGLTLFIVGLIMVPVLIVSVGIPLLVTAVVIGGVLLLLSGIGAVLCSPLLLLALVVWLIVRTARKPANRAPSSSSSSVSIRP